MAPTRQRKPSQKILESYSRSVVDVKAKVDVRRRSTFCMICKHNFRSKKDLNDHNCKHHFFRHCPNCPRSFQQTRTFILHLRSHLEDHPYECKICLQSFNQKSDMLIHKKLHKNVEKLSCDLCSEVLPHLSSLNRHRLMHSGPPFPCDQCDAVFRNVSDRTVHLKNHVHRCILCPREIVTFSSNAELASHIYCVHRTKEYDHTNSEAMQTLEPCVSTGAVTLDENDSDILEALSSSSDDESDVDTDCNYQKEAVESVYNLKCKGKFICFICYDLYPSSELLKAHMSAHKWFPCAVCPRFFEDLEALRQHKCDNVKVPSFTCEACNTKIECENCKKKCRTIITDESNGNALQNVPHRALKMPRFPVMDYTNIAHHMFLIELINQIKHRKEPLDVKSVSSVFYHYENLNIILNHPNVNSLFPKEHIPALEELYSKFHDLANKLCKTINHPV